MKYENNERISTALGPIQKFEGSMYSIICTDRLVTIT